MLCEYYLHFESYKNNRLTEVYSITPSPSFEVRGLYYINAMNGTIRYSIIENKNKNIEFLTIVVL